jgi:alkylated DNA repair dioxygenase AlkB
MPIFDNELLGNQSNREYSGPDVDISSSGEAFREIDSTIGLDIPGQFDKPFEGITADQARTFKGASMPMNVNSPFSVVSKSELLENQRYPLYERGINLENVYGLQQSGLEQLGNGLIKMGALALGSFGQSFATIPNTAKALKNLDLADLSNPNGYESSIDTWMKNVENYFPNYVTNYEKSRGLATAIPFTYGSANFWGDKILKNSGFMVGAISGAIVQDAIIGAATEGIGAIPLVGVQLGKASLYLNKLFAGTNKVDKVLDLARAAGKSEQTLMNIERLGQLAAATKLSNGFRYGMSVYGSARTEAAIESRESYRTIKEQLTEQYRLDNFGEEPSPEAITQIEEYATDAMNTRFGINMALLTVSNAVQFDNVFKSFTGAQKGITSSALKDFGSAGKVGLKEGTLDTFERKVPETFSGKAWEFVKPKAINVFTEGVYEEGGQFATQIGVEDYYTRKYKNKESWDFVKEAMTSTTKGLAEQFGSSAGIESMVIGGITAAITGPIADRVTGKSKADTQRLNTTLNLLNQYGMTGVLSNKYEDTSRGVEIGKQMNDAVNSGNIFKYKNLKSDMFFGFVNSRIPIGMHDVTIEQLNMLKDLPKAEFEKTFGMDFSSSNKSTVNEYVNALIDKANNINDVSTSINSTFNNPYNRIIDPKTADQRVEALKYGMFENWKTDLANFSYVQQDSADRIAEIQTSISQVNPLLTNDLLTLTSSENGLKELSESYEQKANQLSESLANLSPAERTAKRDEIKKLRTLSEKISIALNSKNIDPKLFNELINFELVNQDFSQPNTLRIDETSGLTTYAEDLNKIEARKKGAADKFDYLSTEEGFNKYFKQAEDIANEEVSLEDLNKGTAQPSFVNEDKEKEKLEVGREYEVRATKKASIKKIADDRYQVTSPDGTVSFHKTRKEAVEESKDLTDENTNLSKVKVLGLNDDGTVKVEDVNGDILNIDPKRLRGYKRLETNQEKLQKNKEDIAREQTDLEHNSGTIASVSSEAAETIKESRLPDASILFLSSSSASEEDNPTVAVAPFITNSREFLNNVAGMSNRSKLRSILITSKQAEGLQLDGIVQMSYEKDPSTSIDSIEEVNNINSGWVAQVFVEQDVDGLFFVDKNGNRIGKVGEAGTDLNKIIFQTMRTTSLFNRSGQPRYRQEQKAEAEAYSRAWGEYRKSLFEAGATEFPTFEFSVSKGLPIELRDANGLKEKNHVGGILIDESLITNQANLIVIPTTGTIVNSQGEIQKTPVGVPLLQYGDNISFLNNRMFNDREAAGVYEVIKRLADAAVEQATTGQRVTLNRQFTTFLQNVLYWKSKDETTSPNQIRIDTESMSLKLGNNSYPLSDITQYEAEIKEHLTEKAYISLNNKTLTDFAQAPFEEWYINQAGEFVSSKWANYQTFLLSNKYPSGQARPMGDTPLSTSIAKPTPAKPYSFKQRYSTIAEPDNFNVQVITPVQKAKEEAPAGTNVYQLGNYVIGNKTPNTFPLQNGDVQFTAEEDAEGNFNVEVESNETTAKLLEDKPTFEKIKGALKAANRFDASIPLEEEEKYITDYLALRISAELNKLKSEAPTQVAPVAEEKTTDKPVINIYWGSPESSTNTKVLSNLAPRKFIYQDKEYGSVEHAYQTLKSGSFDQVTYDKYVKAGGYGTKIRGKAVTKGFDNLQLMKDLVVESFKQNPNQAALLLNYSNFTHTTNEIIDKAFLDGIKLAQNNAEQAALETPVEKPTTPVQKKPGGDFRKVGLNENERMTEAELELFKEWHAENVPNIPFEVLEDLIDTYDGEKAWGVFENGIAKFVRGGLRATEYHEIFEGIYKGMLSQEEQQALLDEFKSKSGTFTDRASGKKINYADATDLQAKERIADDFSDYRKGKLPARSLGERVRNLFKRIMDFFKSFVSKPSLKESLFKSINEGKFKERTLSEESINPFSEYSRVSQLSAQQANNFVQDMTARAAGILFREGDKSLLFNPERITGTEMFGKIEDMLIEEGRRQLLSDKTFEDLKQQVRDQLRTRGINFNDEEVQNINDEEANKNDYAPEPFKLDTKKNASPAVKFLCSTLIEREATNQESAITLSTPLQSKLSKMVIDGNEIEGYKLMNFSRVFATLLDKLSNTSSVGAFTNKLFNLAQDDANYVSVFQKVGGKDKVVPFSKFNDNDWRLFIDFIQTFARQKPNALIQYKSADSVHTGAANLFTATQQTEKEWMTNIQTLAKGDGTIVKYTNNKYVIDQDALKAMPIRKPKPMIAMLNAIGVTFDYDTYVKLKENDKLKFAKQVESIYGYFGSNNDLMSISGKTLDVGGPLSTLAELYNKVNNPSQESTYFGVENQRIGAFSENNTPSVFENEFNETANIVELKQKRTELNDTFSTGSQVLKKGGLFYDKNGNKIKDFKVSVIQGEDNQDTDKGTSTSKLTIGDRFTMEINQNLNGNYYILIPADGSTEWMMNLGNNVSFDSIAKNSYKEINSIFKGYLMDDINLALDYSNREKLLNVGGKAKELRFFKDILAPKDLEAINEMIEDGRTLEDITAYVNENISDINNSVKEFISNMTVGTMDILKANDKINPIGEDTYAYQDLDDNFLKAESLNKNNLSNKDVNNILTYANVNYIIANIEFHKILFGDPYQFAVKKNGALDETKRIKSFLSPRRTTFDSAEYNTYLNNNVNNANGIQLKENDPGYHLHKSHTDTITVKDIKVAGSLSAINELYGDTNEADAVSWLMDTTYREIKLKNRQWDLQGVEEKWFQWEMAYTRQNLPGYEYTSEALRTSDTKLMETDRPKYTTEILKPIVSGNKANKNNFDLVLDKFSQVPIYYSMVKGTNLEKLYVQMKKQGIGYAIVESGRKVGAQELHSLYNGDGSFNNEAFSDASIVQVPWKAYGIQVETTTTDNKSQTTRGSQITKIASIDLFDNGVPTSPRAAEEYKRNTDLLNAMHQNAYNELLNNLGLEDLNNGFVMKNGRNVSETLMREMMRREVSNNTKQTIKLNTEDQFMIPFEASPSYVQIRSILYSMIDKAIGSPKVSGGSHVQMPATMLESMTKGRSIAMKNKEGVWEKITKEKYETLTSEEKAGVMLTDDSLKFYTKEQPYCEILLPHWFKDKFKNKFKTDKELLKYLNGTEEGRSILSGIGFRIPTQALSSAEVFRVKGFLPSYMGATVVVPSEITTKSGSDFDIDKLNMYLKSVYADRTGNIKLVKLQGNEENTKEFFGKVFDDTLGVKQMKKADLLEALDIVVYGLEDPKGLLNVYGDYIKSKEEQYENPYEFRDLIEKDLNKLTDINLQAELRSEYVKDMYKKALENEYYDSLEKLLTLPENFERLITPIDDAGLKDVAEELDGLRGMDENKIPNRILNRNYMTNLRNSFLMGKRWVGVVAVNITNLSLRQKIQSYVDPAKFSLLSEEDQELLGDGSVVLKHNTTKVNGVDRISLGGTRTADGSNQLISNRLSGYATAVVDVAKDDFITRIIQSNLVIGTFMFLENIGAGQQSIFFLNQPIISEYLRIVNANNSSNLFYEDNINYAKSLFPSTKEEMDNAVINVDGLKGNISKYATSKLTPKENGEQQAILKEFLKYAKMAEFNFDFTQATNYDTSRFGSGDMFARKQWQTEKANDVNIISSAKEILDNTFLGNQSKLLSASMQAMGAIFKLEQDHLRIITEDIMKTYGKNKYLSIDNFNKISNKAKMAFLDYIIQTKTGVNGKTEDLLVNAKTSVANRLEVAKEKYPEIQLLKDLQVVPSVRENGAKSVELRANIKDAYDEDLYVDMMRELRDYNAETKVLYEQLISLAILQGSYQSAISIKNIIPIEDYADIVAPVVNSISSDETLQAFVDGMFQRNNFDDPFIMPRVTPFFKPKSGNVAQAMAQMIDPSVQIGYYSSSFPEIKSLNLQAIDRQVLVIGDKYNQKAMNSDYVAVPRVVKLKSGVRIDVLTGNTVTAANYAARKKKGDYSLNDVLGYKRVFVAPGVPLRIPDKKGFPQSVYKLINLYGDGNRATENYTDFRPSVIDNGTLKTTRELNDVDIVSFYGGEIVENNVSLPTEVSKPTQMAGQPKGIKVKEGIYVNQEALTKDEQLELFDYIKPFLEEQAAKTNKGASASKMIGLGLRWDYKSNNPGKQSMNIPDVINQGNKTKYGYYDTSINNQPLAPITPRFRELMQKATGVDMTNYDGAIINLYEPTSFISSHNDVDESRSAIGYPVIGINIGGTGNFSIESRDGAPKQLNLQPGSGYVFGVDGVNREVYHRTFPKPQDSFLPELTTNLDGKTYEPGSYRVTVTMRRVMPLEPGMPTKPAIISTQENKPDGLPPIDRTNETC